MKSIPLLKIKDLVETSFTSSSVQVSLNNKGKGKEGTLEDS